MSLCECGCGQLAPLATENNPRWGWAKGEPKRFVHGHNGRRSLEDSYEVDPDTGCWVWIASRSSAGYGHFQRNLRTISAHKFFYERATGPVPEGLVLDHLCRVPACVNPEHLEAVTQRENVMRGVGITALNATKTHCKRGHPLAGPNLIRTSTGKRQCRECTALSRSGAIARGEAA